MFLYKCLLLDCIFGTGTLRPIRHNFPPDLKLVVKRFGRTEEMMVKQEGNVCVTVRHDVKPVTCMLSGHNPEHTSHKKRRRGKSK